MEAKRFEIQSPTPFSESLLWQLNRNYYHTAGLNAWREGEDVPEIITHGSFSIWVNYHAYRWFCEKQGGRGLFPAFSNFYLELACLMLVPAPGSYTETQNAYRRFVDDFGPDDFNGFKRFAHLDTLDLSAE